MATATLISLEEYLALPLKEDVSYEYDEGRVIEVPTHNVDSARIQARAIVVLDKHLEESRGALFVTGPTGFWLNAQVERIPDVCVLRADKLAAMEVFHGSRRGAPDLAIEIVSPNESATELERKIDQYLAAGVTGVVLLYPESRHVRVCRTSGETRRLGAGEFLEIAELLPGLRIPIDDLFPPRP